MLFLKWLQVSKGLLALMLGSFALIVGVDNLLDFNTNFQFVQHVMRMDTLQPWFSPTSPLRTRAISSTTVHYAAYIAIISCEILTGLLYLSSGYFLLRATGKDKSVATGKILFSSGSILGLALWYFGFCIVAGEYFCMWANTYNAYKKAYLLSSFILLATLFVCQKEYRL